MEYTTTDRCIYCGSSKIFVDDFGNYQCYTCGTYSNLNVIKKYNGAKMKKVFVVMYEDSILSNDQSDILCRDYPNWEFLYIPNNGWNLRDMIKQCDNIELDTTVIFASPIMAMMSIMNTRGMNFEVFYNAYSPTNDFEWEII